MSGGQAARPELFSEGLIRAYVDEDPRFVARPWLAELLDAQIADPRCRFVLLSGEPGSGKTALMASLARAHPEWLRYFIRRDSQRPLNSGDARSVLFALGHQLAALHPGVFRPERLEVVVRQRVGEVVAGGQMTGIKVEDLAVSPFYATALRVEQDAELVAGALTGISATRLVAEERMLEVANLQYLALLAPASLLLREDPDARVVVLVDALDELRYHPGGETALDWLAACPELPANVRIVLSSRPDERLLESFRNRQGTWLREAAIDADPDALTRDLTRYATSFTEEARVVAVLDAETVGRGDFVAAVVARADGNFQYLATLFNGLEQRIAALTDGDAADAGERRAELRGMLRLEDVPPGLGALYAFFLGLIRDAVADERVEVPGARAGERERLPAWEGLYQPTLGVLAVAAEPLSAAQIACFGAVEAEARWLRGALARLTQFLDRVDGRYRLYHATFPEYLTAPETGESHPDDYLDPAEWQRTITRQAIAACGNDWLSCEDHYIRDHLAGHAAAAGLLDGLLTDAGFLLVAEPAELLRSIANAVGDSARQAAAVYERVVYAMSSASTSDAASHLELAARQAGLDWLADRAGTIDAGQHWRARWARWQPPGPSRVVGRHAGPVGAIAVVELDGRTIAVSCGGDGSIRRWDLAARRALGSPLHGHGDLVRTLAVSELEGRPVAVAGGLSGAVGLWDLRSGEPLWMRPGHRGLITGVALATVDGRRIVVTGGYDRTLRLWDFVSGEALGEPRRGDARLTAVAAGERDGRPVAVSGDWDGNVHRWDLAAVATPGTPVWSDHAYVRALAITELEGRLVALSAAGFNREIDVWDVDSGAAAGSPLRGHEKWVGSLAAGQLDGHPVAISGGAGGMVRVWDLQSRLPIGDPLPGHEDPVMAVALSDRDDQVIALAGGSDGTVRLWDLRAEATRSQAGGDQPGWVTALAVGDVDGRWAAVSGGRDGTISLWDTESGERLGEPPSRHEGRVTAVAITAAHGGAVGVSAGEDGSVSRWDLFSGRALGELGRTDAVRALAVVELEGRPVVIAASRDGTVHRWDASTGQALTAPQRRYRAALSALAVTMLDGRPVAVTGGDAGALRVWDVASGEALGAPLRGHKGSVRAVAVSKLDGRAVAISGGERDGKLRLWDLTTGSALGKHVATEKRRVCALAATETTGRPLAISGGGWNQGTLRVWDLMSRREEFAVELGAKITAIAVTPSRIIVGTRAGLLGVTLAQDRAWSSNLQ